MSEALVGLVGVAMGAAAAFFGTFYTTRDERRRRREEVDARVRVASRAWREDFYAVQETLVARLRDGRWTEPFPTPLATDAHLLVLAERFRGHGAWTRVTATRRRIARARAGVDTMPDSAVAALFVDIEKGRKALSTVDSGWPFSPHPAFVDVEPHIPTDKVRDDPPESGDD